METKSRGIDIFVASISLGSFFFFFFTTSSRVSKDTVFLLHFSLPEVPTVFKLCSSQIFMEDYQIFLGYVSYPTEKALHMY